MSRMKSLSIVLVLFVDLFRLFADLLLAQLRIRLLGQPPTGQGVSPAVEASAPTSSMSCVWILFTARFRSFGVIACP